MPEVITNNLDLWTSALLTKSTAGRGSNGKLEAYGIKKLRELILELAVRGKLVPQDPNDEPAAEPLKKIAKEKAQLIKEGKLAKQKPLLPISEEERLDLPTGWEWVRFGYIFELEYGNNLPEAKRSNTGEYPVYGSNGVVGTHNQYCVGSPCIVVGRKGSAGALNLCLDEKCWVTDVAYSVAPPTDMDLKFVFKLFHTLGLDNLGKGIKPGLNRNEAYVVPVAIPPLNEQRRIVAKVDELMALCDQLEQQQTHSIEAHQTLVETLLGTLTRVASQQELSEAWTRIANHFDTLITTDHSVDQLKQTILQLAVMGKLVPQDPSDEPASVLLKNILAEKRRLILAGKIKSEKQLPLITGEEKWCELPSGWEWVRFSDYAVDIATGPFGTMIHQSDYVANGVPLINPSHMINDQIVPENEISVTEEMAKDFESYSLADGDIVMARRGEVGRIALVTKREAGWLCGTGSFVLRFSTHVVRDYLKLVFRCDFVRNYLAGEAVGTTMVNLNHGILKKMPFAVPPVAEQHRIVAKVDELMALCDALKAYIKDAQTTQLHLADAIVEQAVA